MAKDKQISISAALLEQLVIATEALYGVVDTTKPDANQLLASASKAVTPAVQLLRAAFGPQSFSGSEIGDYHIDPSQSSFL